MSSRIIISSFAAIAIGMSCIATDASARGGGGGGGGGGFGGGGMRSWGAAPGMRSSITGPMGGGAYGGGRYFGASGAGRFAAPGVRRIVPSIGGVGGPRTFYRLNGVLGPGGATGGGAAGMPGGGVAAGALYYAPPVAYDSLAGCGRYPYPPCKERAKAKKTPAVEPDD